MTKPNGFRVTEAYSFALVPVVGPLFEAIGHVARNLGDASDRLEDHTETKYLPESDPSYE